MSGVGWCTLNVTAHPTAEWTTQQLREAFPFKQIPRYLLRDRDKIFGDEFRRQVRDMNIEEVLSAPRSPWQRAYIERLIGPIRRECLDHVIVCNETSLRRILTAYFSFYHAIRPHLFAGEGLAGTTESASAGVGPSDLDPASRRSSPSLRTTRRLKQFSWRRPLPRSAPAFQDSACSRTFPKTKVIIRQRFPITIAGSATIPTDFEFSIPTINQIRISGNYNSYR
jgi:hypothetical protein